ncbi:MULTISPECIES: alpha/beta fold hydrolase [unclassified Frankia]|uniref:alpha/beta hydrolase family protein n=1 Tax=unclassified Frankia TaxID=2632575 RepID=UPI001EF5D657|nr:MULTISPECIES: alpha/beta fold hydrolase [unclassified Frankia]
MNPILNDNGKTTISSIERSAALSVNPRAPIETDVSGPPSTDIVPITTEDGSTFVLRLFSQQDQTAPAVLLLPAMGVPATYYKPFVQELCRRGLSVVTVDLRGQGESVRSTRPGTRSGYQVIIEQDLPAIIETVHRRYPAAPLFLLGHSLGGTLGILYASVRPDTVAGVAVIATGTTHVSGFGRRGPKILLQTRAVYLVTRILGHWPGHRLGFAGRQPAGLMLDWCRHARTGRYEPAGSEQNFEQRLRELSVPVLAVSLDDDLLAPRRAVDILCAKLGSAPLARLHLDRASGQLRLGHIDWIRDGGTIAARMTDWVTTVRQ